eukprot:9387982-Alexandrium_andersonii.AAC.1
MGSGAGVRGGPKVGNANGAWLLRKAAGMLSIGSAGVGGGGVDVGAVTGEAVETGEGYVTGVVECVGVVGKSWRSVGCALGCVGCSPASGVLVLAGRAGDSWIL